MNYKNIKNAGSATEDDCFSSAPDTYKMVVGVVSEGIGGSENNSLTIENIENGMPQPLVKTDIEKSDFDVDKAMADLNAAGKYCNYDEEEEIKRRQRFIDLTKKDWDERTDNYFPVEVFPRVLQEIIADRVKGLNFQENFISASLLHAAATAIGDTYRVNLLWEESPLLYMVFVGPPGVGKSHPIEWAYRPLIEIDRQSWINYQNQCKDFAKASKEQKILMGEPVLKQIVLTDTTTEGLTDALAINQRGIGIVADEISGHFKITGRTQAMWLSIWSQKPIRIQRKTTAPIRIEKPLVNMIGGIQPALLKEIFKNAGKLENGYADRCLYVIQQSYGHKEFDINAVHSDADGKWSQILTKLANLSFDKDGMPCILRLNEDSKKILIRHLNIVPKSLKNIDDETVNRINAKMRSYVQRFLIPLHFLRWATGETEKDIVDIATAEAAVKLSVYFTEEAYSAWEQLASRNPLDSLSKNKVDIYNRLYKEFSTGEAIDAAQKFGMSERNMKYWLKDEKLFRRLGHGYYEKIYKAS